MAFSEGRPVSFLIQDIYVKVDKNSLFHGYISLLNHTKFMIN